MTEFEVREKLRLWASLAQGALLDYSGCFQVFYQEPARVPRETEFTLGQLHLRATSTSDSILFLVSEMKLWDADILVRSVMEATLKFVFICTAEAEEQRNRVDEFLNVLPRITSLRRHRRAVDFLNRIADSDFAWRPLKDQLLSDEEVVEINNSLPKEVRSRLEGKWGFTRMTEALVRSEERFQDLAGLLYSYGMGSHSVHQDGDAILMMHEREKREDVRQRAIELAHGAREIGDVMTFSMIRAVEAYRSHDLDPHPVHHVAEKYEALSAELQDAHKLWHSIEFPVLSS